MDKTLTIKSGKDNGFNRFNAYDGYLNVSSTNDLDAFLDDIRAFLTSEPWEADDEPDYEAMLERRSQPTYREEVLMDRGIIQKNE